VRCSVCQRRLPEGAPCKEHPEAPPLAEPVAPDEPPPPIEGYEITGTLGAGGFARVHRATRQQAEVALKIGLRPGDLRFAREAAALRRIGAPTVPAFIDEGTTADGLCYLAMELVHGTPVSTWLARQPDAKAPLEAALGLFAAIGHAVDQVHAAGVLHRDLKPENMFSRPDGQVTLLDLGLATPLDEAAQVALGGAELTTSGQRLGTVIYMAPEQCSLGALDHRSDLYALGVILFELLSSRPPFVGDATAIEQGHVVRRPPRLSELAGTPEVLDPILDRCLAKEKEQRFGSAKAIVDAIKEALRPARPKSQSSNPATVAPTSSKTRKIALLSVRALVPVPQIAAAVGAERGSLARAFGDRLVIGFSEMPSPEAGVKAALRCIERLGGLADQIVIHAADLRVREGADGPIMIGSALEKATVWGQPGATEHVVLTTEAAGFAGTELRPASVEGLFTAVTRALKTTAGTGELRLIGRASVLDQLLVAARGALSSGVPALCTIAGETGLGRTRLLSTIAGTLAAEQVVVELIAAPHPEREDATELLARMFRAAFAIAPTTALTVELVRNACAEVLPADEHATAWPTVAFGLGLIGDADPAIKQVIAAPSALRQTLAHAIGTGLRARGASRSFALLLDDAQWADHAILDALEVATLGGTPARVAVITTARSAGDAPVPRAQWGERAASSTVITLAPLDPPTTRELLLELLRPVEYLPEQIAARLHEMVQGVPLYAIELVHALKARGVIRALGKTEMMFVAADDLLTVSATPLVERLATHQLEGLSPALAGLTHVCAVLGEHVETAELDGVLRLLGADLGPTAELDAKVGLERLAHVGVVQRKTATAFAFRHPLVREAIEALIEPVARRKIHDAIRRFLATTKSRSAAILSRVARHAAACGMADEAVRAHMHLAKEASLRHRYVEGEQHYTAALALLADNAKPATIPTRMQAFTGRGRMRYRVWRMADASTDLDEALKLARQKNDDAAVVDLLLEQATIKDWWHDFAASSALVEQARELASPMYDPLLDARCTAALGRSHYRFERLADAIEQLEAGAAQGEELSDYETRVLALILLSPALVFAGRLEDAEARFGEIIELCEKAGDRMHLGTAYVNRMTLWMKRQDYEQAADDAKLARALAQDIGHVHLERMAVYNLGELLLWLGRPDEGLPHAERARSIQLRFFEHAVIEDALLVARIHAGRGDRDQTRELLDWIKDKALVDGAAPSQRALFRALELAASGDGTAEAWEPLLTEASQYGMLDEHLEMLHAYGTIAIDRESAGKRIAEALDIAAGSPTWKRRFDALSARRAP
jgi:tetratricopeptide (TPR) repeat protein